LNDGAQPAICECEAKWEPGSSTAPDDHDVMLK
jgi:hypothetical protein